MKRLFSVTKQKTRSNDKHITENGLLYRIGSKGNKNFKQLVTPNSYRAEILTTGHDSVTAGHLGRTATFKKISENFTWPGMTKDVRHFVNTCVTCKLATKLANSNSKAEKYTTFAENKRQFQVGNKVMVLLPEDSNTPLMTWKGPFTVASLGSGAKYVIQMRNRLTTFHEGRLKLYTTRNRAAATNYQHEESTNISLAIKSEENERNSPYASNKTSKQAKGYTSEVKITSDTETLKHRNHKELTHRKIWKHETLPMHQDENRDTRFGHRTGTHYDSFHSQSNQQVRINKRVFDHQNGPQTAYRHNERQNGYQ